MKVISVVFLIAIIFVVIATTDALSCRAGRGACVASCQVQNCATGYCPNGPQGICVCSRCGIGKPPYP